MKAAPFKTLPNVGSRPRFLKGGRAAARCKPERSPFGERWVV